MTALEVREPFIAGCETAATEFGLFAVFHQPQQHAFSGYNDQGNRTRIGNGKHKNWQVDFQPEASRDPRADNVGKLVIQSFFDPSINQFGGFDYGKYGEPEPTYSFVTLAGARELGWWNATDPPEDLLEAALDAVTDAYNQTLPLFD